MPCEDDCRNLYRDLTEEETMSSSDLINIDISLRALIALMPLTAAIQAVVEAAHLVGDESRRETDAEDYLDRLRQTGWPDTARALRNLLQAVDHLDSLLRPPKGDPNEEE